jgi:invasion protein IalB
VEQATYDTAQDFGPRSANRVHAARLGYNGCVAEVVMDKLLGQLRTAKTATFIIFETPEEGIGFPLSLNGIGDGYDKLP